MLSDEITRAVSTYARLACRRLATATPAGRDAAADGGGSCGGAAAAPGSISLVDIGANLLDPMFQGEYREKPRHPADLPAVLGRALDAGVERIMVTAGSLQEALDALELCESGRGRPEWPRLACTVGVHPTRCGEFEAAAGGPQAYLAELLAVGRRGMQAPAPGAAPCLAAVGECGLDYDRLHFCARETQLRFLELQLSGLAAPLGLPLFLHCRTQEAAADLLALLRRHRPSLPTPPGVVHSFDGRPEDARGFLELGFYVGLNGCSLRTAENLEAVRGLPPERLLLETDAPWCGIKASHAGHHHVRSAWEEVKKPERWEPGKCVKDRCEPCHLRQVLEVVAGCRGTTPEALAAQVHANTLAVFFRA